MTRNYPSLEQLEIIQNKFKKMTLEHWLDHDLFNWRWFILLFFTFFPWIIWWRVVDRQKISEIFLFGLINAVVATMLDTIGWGLGFWWYPHNVLLFVPFNLTLDLAVLPVINMLIYQYFRGWKSFLISNSIMAAVLSFIGEPLLIWANIYEPYKWKHIFSFPLYIALSYFYRLITQRIILLQHIRR